MGLDTSHDAFHGSYGNFNRLRKAVARAIGGSHSPHDDKSLDEDLWYSGEGYTEETHPGLFEFLSHSDCDGEIGPETCAKVAEELEAIIPLIEGDNAATAEVYRKYVARLAAGCRLAHSMGEPLTFA